jgi:sugar (pentulose or hexulose) kinase
MQSKADLVLGIDCSTTGVKAIAWDREGNAAASGRSSLALLRPRPDWHEQNAADWWSAAAEALRQVAGQIDPGRIAALSISHQRETFVPVNEKCQPLRNAILWMDERARPLIPGLRNQFGYARFHAITGKPLSGNLTIAKIAWLSENEPAVVKRSAFFLDVHAYLVQRLTGKVLTGWGCADPMGLFDITLNDWSQELITGVGLKLEQFPTAFPPGAVLGEMTPQAAKDCKLKPGILVAAGLGDGQAAGLGANITRKDEAYLSMGTSFISGVFSEKYQVDPAFRTLYAGIPGTYFIETAILGGSYIIRWFVETFGSLDDQAPGVSTEAFFEAKASQVPPGSLGLLLVPYWNSAMGPYWDASASGIVVGWRGAHGRAHLYRAILEGIAFEQCLNTRGVERALGTRTRRYIAAGGGAQNDLWRQVVADITGIPVFRSTSQECAALGAGILAASAAGMHTDTRHAAQAMAHTEEQGTEPDSKRQAYYQKIYEEVYVNLFPALQKYLSRLTELTENEQEGIR